MLGIIGNILINTALLSGILSLIGYFLYSNRRKKQFLTVSNWFFGLKGLLILIASGILIYLILTHQFQYYYVYNYTSSNLQLKYLISAYWGGQEGSFMLWIVFSSLVGLALMKWSREPYRGPVMFFMVLTQIFLLSMISGIEIAGFKLGASPFRTMAEAFPNAPFIQSNPDFIPTEGKGLNDMLKSPWMIAHPPALFLAFALMTVPYSYAMAALWKRKYHEWISEALPWTLGANLWLFAAILLGGYWAYVTLSFGGYWAWDPVENASLIPWLIGTAGIHTMAIQQKRSVSPKSSIVFAILAYIAVVYETFLTRSGVLSDASVHSFTDLGLYGQLVLFMIAILGIGVAMFIYRHKDFPKSHSESKILSREFMTFAGAMVLFLIGLVITLGTSSPIIGKLFVESPTPPEVSYYTDWTMPLAILTAILTVLGQFLFWKRQSAKSFEEELYGPVIAACISTLVILFIGNVRNLYYMVYLLSAMFAIFGNGLIMIRLARKKIRLIGGALSHLGFGILLLGILSSSAYDTNLLDKTIRQYNQAVKQGKVTDDDGALVHQTIGFLELMLDEPKIVNDKYMVTYEGYTLKNQDRPGQQEYKIKFEEIDEGGKGDSFYLYPQVYPMSSSEDIQWSVDVDVSSGFLSDVYLYVAGSSYVDRKNEQYKELKKSRDENFVQSVSQNLGETQQDSIPVQKITLAKGEATTLGDHQFMFRDFSPADSSALPENTIIAVHAQVGVKYKANDTPHEINPLFLIFSHDDKSMVFNPPEKLPDHNMEIQFSNVIPETGEIELTVTGVSENQEDEWVLLTAEEKPFVSLVWIGTFLLMSGFAVSIFRHTGQLIKKREQNQNKS